MGESGTSDTQLIKLHASALCLKLGDQQAIQSILQIAKDYKLDEIPVDLRLTTFDVACRHDSDLRDKVKAYYKEVHSREPIQTQEKQEILKSLKMSHKEALTDE